MALLPAPSLPTKTRRSPDCFGRGSTREIDLNVVAHDSYLVGLEIARNGWAQALPGLNLKSPRVQRTLDHLAVEPAIGEHREGMGADIVSGVDGAIEIIERDRLPFSFDG